MGYSVSQFAASKDIVNNLEVKTNIIKNKLFCNI